MDLSTYILHQRRRLNSIALQLVKTEKPKNVLGFESVIVLANALQPETFTNAFAVFCCVKINQIFSVFFF